MICRENNLMKTRMRDEMGERDFEKRLECR
jgi:hypothetical protein